MRERAEPGSGGGNVLGSTRGTTTGWKPACECAPADPIPCVVLDPFGGSGTVCVVSERLGRKSISIELNSEYVAMAEARAGSAAALAAPRRAPEGNHPGVAGDAGAAPHVGGVLPAAGAGADADLVGQLPGEPQGSPSESLRLLPGAEGEQGGRADPHTDLSTAAGDAVPVLPDWIARMEVG